MEDKFYKFENKRAKAYKKKIKKKKQPEFEDKLDDIKSLDISEMSATELADYYEDLE